MTAEERQLAEKDLLAAILSAKENIRNINKLYGKINDKHCF
jgi:hypothetical protein